MIRKILIANRGEIACRIIRTCKTMGIATVAVYSDADTNALHVEMADEAVYLGDNAAAESYLNIEKVIAAAQLTHAGAIHPGYGFLAENANFARAVSSAGIVFIGPAADTIEVMGKKREAKLILHDIPLVPGYQDDDQKDETLIQAANEIGFPVMVKASSGGGGKGMRRVDEADALPDALAAARREAMQAFGDDTLILERYVENPRHIEVQIIGDNHGHVFALGERECSVQRRHQKIIEEAPSPAVDDDLRERMTQTAIRIGEQLNYTNAGTVEFLLDDDGNFYFMEMNTRLQVEHPVTEMVYGVDLVKLQIHVAEGHDLTNVMADVQPDGHAIEVRIYAENPENAFLPATGTLLHWDVDEIGVRCDSGVRSGDEISVHYDPMMAKVIAQGQNREAAMRKLDYALNNLEVIGVQHNIAFLRRVINHPEFVDGDISTSFIDVHPELLTETTTLPPTALIAAALAQHHPHKQSNYWRNNPYRPIKIAFTYRAETIEVAIKPGKEIRTYVIIVGDATHYVRLVAFDNVHMTLVTDGHRQQLTVICADEVWRVHLQGEVYRLQWQNPLPLPGGSLSTAGSLRAPMPGQIIAVAVKAGQQVEEGDILLILEAMKMEHRIQAPYKGTVEAVNYSEGETVQADAVLLQLNAAEGDG